jgi:hypothetical protein
MLSFMVLRSRLSPIPLNYDAQKELSLYIASVLRVLFSRLALEVVSETLMKIGRLARRMG